MRNDGVIIAAGILSFTFFDDYSFSAIRLNDLTTAALLFTRRRFL